MFLANLFSRICSARAQFMIVLANQRASYLFSTCTFRGVLSSSKVFFQSVSCYSGPVGARVIKEVRFQFFFFPVQQNAQ